MAAFWLAPSLEIFRAELNELFPDRDKRSDGWIGDKKHAGGKSDHNPSNHPGSWSGVVRAFDADNDIAANFNGQSLVNLLVPLMGVHPALGSGAYLIYNRKILSTDRLAEGWRPYSGVNPHTGHVHISVAKSATGYNSIQPWFGIITGDENVMQNTEDQYNIFKSFMWRFLKYESRAGGAAATHLNGPTIFEQLATISANSQIAAKNSDGSAAAVDVKALATELAAALPKEDTQLLLDQLAERLKD